MLAPDWSRRRRMAFPAVAVAAAGVLVLNLWGDPENAIHRSTASELLYLIGALALAYFGLPVVDDYGRRRSWVSVETTRMTTTAARRRADHDDAAG